MDNRDYARVLKEVAALMQIQGSNRFRIRAFENAARTIESQSDSLESIMDRQELQNLSGIGESIAKDLYQIRDTGTCSLHESLLEELDPGLLKLLRIQGLGPKKVKALYDELQVSNVDALKAAAEAGKVSSLSGFGKKTEEKILAEIERINEAGDRTPLPRALQIAESMKSQLETLPEVEQIEIAGSLRRGRETIGDIDLLVATKNGEPVHRAFRELTEVRDVLGSGETKTSVRLRNGLQVDLRTVEPKIFGSALHYFTGSKEHHIALRTRAKRMGMKISEYGVFREEDLETPLASTTEAEVFEALGLAFIPPELRENQSEIEKAEKNSLPALLSLEEIRGDIHMHTTETDGKASILEMAEAAKELGYSFIAITDHSQDVRVANGMTPQRFEAHIKAIEAANQEISDFQILSGIEVDILKDGSLDMDDTLLEACDWVVGSIHSYFQQSEEEMTDRLLKALSSGLLSCLGHPTGRILGGREGYRYDFDQIVEAAVEAKVAFEMNGSAGRLDFNALQARRARDKGALIVLGSDAHSTRGLADLRFAVQQARRAGFQNHDVLNVLEAKELLSTVGKRQGKS